MEIRFDDAKPAQLRRFLKERHNIDRHPSATKASLMKVIRDLGHDGDLFEISDVAVEVEIDAASGDTPNTPESIVRALVAQGMDEDEAKEVAGIAQSQHMRKRMLATGEAPYGPGKENMYVTVRIARGAGKFGNHPVHVSVNGERVDIPRGIDWPIRTPYLEVLMHAEQILYEEVMTAPDQPRQHRPRKVLAYPVEYVSDVPYDRRQAERVAAQAMEAMAGNPVTLGGAAVQMGAA